MGIGIHCRIEICIGPDTGPFTDPDFVRAMSEDEIFVWHVPSVFHAIGLGHYDHLAKPLIPLRGFPVALSHSIVQKEHVLVSHRSTEEINLRSQAGFKIEVFSEEVVAQWLRETPRLKAHEIREPQRYIESIENDERLIIDPGCQFPSWLMREEIVQACQHCGIEISVEHEDRHVAHFATVLAWMKSLESVYGKASVRLVFWFDSVL